MIDDLGACYKRLGAAMSAEDFAGAEALLTARHDLLSDPSMANTYLKMAVGRGRIPWVDFFLNHGVDVNGGAWPKDKALYAAACEGEPRMVSFLLGRGSAVNSPDEPGEWRLDHAEGEALPDDGEYCPALLVASRLGPLEVVRLLVEAGAKHEATHRGRSALDYAVAYNQPEIADYLRSRRTPTDPAV